MSAAVPPTTVPPPTGPAPGGSSSAKGPLPMTAGRIAALAIGVPVALALVANAGFSLLAPFAEGRYPVSYTAPSTTTRLTVNADGGQVSLQPTAAHRVTLNGTARYSFIRSTFSAQTTGGDTTMSYHCPPLPSSNCQLNATVDVPASLPVNVSTNGGNVSVTRMTSPVTLHSGGGDLSADQIAGPLDLSTSGGNIALSAISAPRLTASTMGGDIDADQVSSPAVTIHTSGGNVRAADVTSRTVTASSSGGDIEIVFTSVPRDVQVDTSGGNITIVVPPGPAQYNVNAHTAGGNTSNGLTGTKNSPNTITATTGGGDIVLRQGTS